MPPKKTIWCCKKKKFRQKNVDSENSNCTCTLRMSFYSDVQAMRQTKVCFEFTRDIYIKSGEGNEVNNCICPTINFQIRMGVAFIFRYHTLLFALSAAILMLTHCGNVYVLSWNLQFPVIHLCICAVMANVQEIWRVGYYRNRTIFFYTLL